MHPTDFPTDFYDRPPAPAILGFGGSPRKNGNSDVLLDRILKGARGKNVSAAKAKVKEKPSILNAAMELGAALAESIRRPDDS